MADTDANRPDPRDPRGPDVETPEDPKVERHRRNPWEWARSRLRERLRELVA